MNGLVRDASRARKLFLEERHHEHTSSTGPLAIRENEFSFAIMGAGEVAELG